MTTSYNISVLVITSLIVLSLTQSFQCTDHLTGESIECRLCGTSSSSSSVEEVYHCNGSEEAFAHSLEGFSSTVVWLIFAAFHLGKAVEITQLGKRLSLWMIQSFGKSIFGLGFSVVFSGIGFKKIKEIKNKNDPPRDHFYTNKKHFLFYLNLNKPFFLLL